MVAIHQNRYASRPKPSDPAAFVSQFPVLIHRFVFQAQRAGRFGPYNTPAIRGVLGEVLLTPKCTVNQHGCEVCEEVPYCTLQCLYADESPDQGPPPLVINAAVREQAAIQAGERFSFRVSLFGKSMAVFPAVFRALEAAGPLVQKGRPLPSLSSAYKPTLPVRRRPC